MVAIHTLCQSRCPDIATLTLAFITPLFSDLLRCFEGLLKAYLVHIKYKISAKPLDEKGTRFKFEF